MRHPKQFLLVGSLLIALALAIVVGVFLFLQFILVPVAPDETSLRATTTDNAAVPVESEAAPETPAVDSEVLPTQPEATPSSREGIPLSDVPLSDQQKQALETFGVDVETFVLTPEMIRCAEATIGASRVADIQAGAAPAFGETLQLLQCL